MLYIYIYSVTCHNSVKDNQFDIQHKMVIPVNKQILIQAKVHIALLWMALIRYSNITIYRKRVQKDKSLLCCPPEIQIRCNYKYKNNPCFSTSLAILLHYFSLGHQDLIRKGADYIALFLKTCDPTNNKQFGEWMDEWMFTNT